MGRLQPPAQLSGAHHLRAPDTLLPPELRAAIPEHEEEQPDQPGAGRRAEPGAREHLDLDALPCLPGRHRDRDLADAQHAPRAVGEADFLARVRVVAEDELDLGERHHPGGVPLRAGGAVPQRPGRHRHGGEGGEEHRRPEELAPHAQPVEDGLAAPERRAADAVHVGLLIPAWIASRRPREAGGGAKGSRGGASGPRLPPAPRTL